MVAHNYKLSTSEAEAGGLLQVQGQSRQLMEERVNLSHLGFSLSNCKVTMYGAWFSIWLARLLTVAPASVGYRQEDCCKSEGVSGYRVSMRDSRCTELALVSQTKECGV